MQAIAKYFPLAFLAFIVILVALFGNFREPVIILCILPLSLIGIAVGMLLTGFDFGFFPIAGWLGLLGMIIKNVIVLIDEINVQHRSGIDLYTSIVEATVSRTRPVLMAATTTIFGMLPLLFDVAFGGMAVTIIDVYKRQCIHLREKGCYVQCHLVVHLSVPKPMQRRNSNLL